MATGAGPAPADRAHAPARAPVATPVGALHDRFVAAIDDDLDLPTALAVVRETLRADLPADERRWLVLDADFVLGLDLDRAAAAGRGRPRVADGLPADVAARAASAARPRRPRLRDVGRASARSCAELGYERDRRAGRSDRQPR